MLYRSSLGGVSSSSADWRLSLSERRGVGWVSWSDVSGAVQSALVLERNSASSSAEREARRTTSADVSQGNSEKRDVLELWVLKTCSSPGWNGKVEDGAEWGGRVRLSAWASPSTRLCETCTTLPKGFALCNCYTGSLFIDCFTELTRLWLPHCFHYRKGTIWITFACARLR